MRTSVDPNGTPLKDFEPGTIVIGRIHARNDDLYLVTDKTNTIPGLNGGNEDLVGVVRLSTGDFYYAPAEMQMKKAHSKKVDFNTPVPEKLEKVMPGELLSFTKDSDHGEYIIAYDETSKTKYRRLFWMNQGKEMELDDTSWDRDITAFPYVNISASM